jgi:hypothetical protein
MGMMVDHAKQVVWEFMTTKHDDATESVSTKIESLLEALNDFVGAPVTTGFNATLSNQGAAAKTAPAKKVE